MGHCEKSFRQAKTESTSYSGCPTSTACPNARASPYLPFVHELKAQCLVLNDKAAFVLDPSHTRTVSCCDDNGSADRP